MTDQAIPQRLAAAFIACVPLGLLFYFVPWERDPRIESPEKRFDRLNNARRSFLADVVGNLQEAFQTVSVSQTIGNGRLSWQEAEFKKLSAEAELKAVEARKGAEEKLRQRVAALPVVEDIKSAPPEPEIPSRFRRPLTLGELISSGDSQGLRRLLSNGAEPNRRNALGQPPLQILIEKCSARQHQSEYDGCLEKNGYDRVTCAYAAAALAGAEINDERVLDNLNALLSMGANIALRVSEQQMRIENMGDRPTRSMTLVAYAERKCSRLVVETMLSKGAPAKPTTAK